MGFSGGEFYPIGTIKSQEKMQLYLSKLHAIIKYFWIEIQSAATLGKVTLKWELPINSS